MPYHHPDLATDLVAATRAVVEADGAAAVTMAGVAKACGVSVAAPYRHFENKEALLGRVAADGFAELRAAMAAAVGAAAADGADAADRLLAAGVAYVCVATARPHLFELMFRADLRASTADAAPAALADLRSLVEPLELAVPVDVAVRSAWALVHGMAMLRLGGMLTFTERDGEDRLRAELRSLLSGIVAVG